LLELIEKLESDNQWFEQAVAENKEALGETQQALIKVEKENKSTD